MQLDGRRSLVQRGGSDLVAWSADCRLAREKGGGVERSSGQGSRGGEE